MDIDYYKKYEPIDGKWYINRELGSGAFGTVFEVERKDFGNMKSAMKVITIPSSPNELKSFREDNYTLDERSVTSYFYGFVEEIMNEFKLMYQLKGHSNIVSYEDHDIIEHKDDVGWDVFIRMELLTPLSEHFARHAPDTTDIIRLGIDMCKALEVCKEANIIHRDIKPSNIFISDKGDYKLGDFGVARTLEKTSSGLSKKGTYIYMAPEVFKGDSYGATVDIYSLGIVLYKLLNNNMEPFRTGISHSEAENAMAKRMSGVQMPAPANASVELGKIVLKACAFNPNDRYSDPAQMRAELEALLVSENVQTAPVQSAPVQPDTAQPVYTNPEATTGMFGTVNGREPQSMAGYEATTGMFGNETNLPPRNNPSQPVYVTGTRPVAQPVVHNRQKPKSGAAKFVVIGVIAAIFLSLAALVGIFAIGFISSSTKGTEEIAEELPATSEFVDFESNVEALNGAPKFKMGKIESMVEDPGMGISMLLYFSELQKGKSYNFNLENAKVICNGKVVGTNSGNPDVLEGMIKNNNECLDFKIWFQNMEFEKGNDYTVEINFFLGSGSDAYKYVATIDFRVEDDCMPEAPEINKAE